MAVFFWEPTPRQLKIMGFLAVMGPSDEGDVALSFEVRPEDLSRVPDSLAETPGDWIARVELEVLHKSGMVFHDGILWGLTPRGQKLWLLKGQAPRG